MEVKLQPSSKASNGNKRNQLISNESKAWSWCKWDRGRTPPGILMGTSSFLLQHPCRQLSKQRVTPSAAWNQGLLEQVKITFIHLH